MKRIQTAEELLDMFEISVKGMLKEIKDKNNELSKLKETDQTKLHYTHKIMAKWFNVNGNMPI